MAVNLWDEVRSILGILPRYSKRNSSLLGELMITIRVVLRATWCLGQISSKIIFFARTNRGLLLGQLTLIGVVNNGALRVAVQEALGLGKAEGDLGRRVVARMPLHFFM